jgi:hypothetical protein
MLLPNMALQPLPGYEPLPAISNRAMEPPLFGSFMHPFVGTKVLIFGEGFVADATREFLQN